MWKVIVGNNNENGINNGQHEEEDMQQIVWPFTNKTTKTKAIFMLEEKHFALSHARLKSKTEHTRTYNIILGKEYNKQMCTCGPKEGQHRHSNEHDYLEYFYDSSHSRP